jgi:predicted metal-dependent phosphoesterase TrpH
MNKYELHAHTAQCDKCARMGGAELVQLYAEAGYNGMVITDHYFSTFYHWFRDDISETDHKSMISRYLKGYYAAREEGEKRGFTVLSGAEVRFDGTINDYLVYGLEEDDFYRLPLLNRLKNLDELVAVLPSHAVVVQAHPFRDDMTVISPEPLFGIEVYNGGTDAFRNELAKLYATHYGKVMTSGSDVHILNSVGKGGIATERDIRCAKDLVDVLSSGDYTLITKE